MIALRICASLLAVALARPRVVAGVREAVHTLNPFAAQTIDGYRSIGLVFEPLAQVDPKADDLIPWLAESWTRYGTTLRVRVRENVRFHDGRLLSAADVVETFRRFRDPKNKAATWLPLWEGVSSARRVDERTVEFTAAQWTFEMVRNLLTNLRVQPSHRPTADLIGTGPFRAITPMTFRPNEAWWSAPHPDFDLAYKTVGDEVSARALHARGELDFFSVARTGDDVREGGAGEGFWIDLNVRRPPFDDRRVREAMLKFWDRANLNAKIFDGRRLLALDTFDPATTNYPAGRPVAFDPAAGERLLNAAGWTKDGAVWRRGERTLEFGLLFATPEQERWASLFQADLARRGITVRLTRRSLDGAWWRLLRDGDFDAAAGGGPPAPMVNADAWRSTGAYAIQGLKVDAIDRVLREQDREFDHARRASNARRLIELVRAQFAQLPGLFAPHALYLTAPRLRFDPARPQDPSRWRVEAPAPPGP